MNDFALDVPTPAEEDPEIDRMLGGLRSFRPASPCFADRVLASVVRPAPFWVEHFRARYRGWLAAGRGWKVAGAFALGGLVPTVAAVVAVGMFADDVGGGLDWLMGVGLPAAWLEVRAEAARAFAPAIAVMNTLAPTRAALAAEGAGLLLALVGCALGLARTLKVEGVRYDETP